jgi:hypothetical protein
MDEFYLVMIIIMMPSLVINTLSWLLLSRAMRKNNENVIAQVKKLLVKWGEDSL